MRILFLTGEFPPMQGGVGDCTNEIARALAAMDVHVCVLTSTKATGPSAIRNSQHLHRTQVQVFAIRPIVHKWNWSSLRVIRKVIREFAPDIVHIQFQTAAFAMHPAIYFAPRFLRPTKFVVTFHDLRVPYLFPKAGPVRNWLTRFFARSCAAVIATNEEDYSRLETWDLGLLALVPIGSNIPITQSPNFQRDSWRAQLGVAENETLLCYFGFLNESKGGETLIRAFYLLVTEPRYNLRAKLLMIGGQVGASDPTNAAYLAKVKKEIRDLGLEDRVLWTDYTPPEIVTANFLASDICVLPYRGGASFRRGTLMAALAHGMAIVTTSPPSPAPPSPSPVLRTGEGEGGAGSGVRLRDGANCLLVQPDDPRALADAIARAAQSTELRAKIGAGARTLAEHFTWDQIAHQHLELYKQIAN